MVNFYYSLVTAVNGWSYFLMPICPALFALNINNIPHANDAACPPPELLAPPNRVKKIRDFKKTNDKKRSFAAYMLLEAVFGKDVAFRVTEDQYGKPYIEGGLHFSLSHSGEWALLAASETNVGADIEIHKQSRDIEGIARRFFSPTEYEAIKDAKNPCALFFDLWTIKESYTKMLGRGFSERTMLSCVEIAADGNQAFLPDDPAVVFRLYRQIQGYSVSVCSTAGVPWPDTITIIDGKLTS